MNMPDMLRTIVLRTLPLFAVGFALERIPVEEHSVNQVASGTHNPYCHGVAVAKGWIALGIPHCLRCRSTLCCYAPLAISDYVNDQRFGRLLSSAVYLVANIRYAYGNEVVKQFVL